MTPLDLFWYIVATALAITVAAAPLCVAIAMIGEVLSMIAYRWPFQNSAGIKVRMKPQQTKNKTAPNA